MVNVSTNYKKHTFLASLLKFTHTHTYVYILRQTIKNATQLDKYSPKKNRDLEEVNDFKMCLIYLASTSFIFFFFLLLCGYRLPVNTIISITKRKKNKKEVEPHDL